MSLTRSEEGGEGDIQNGINEHENSLISYETNKTKVPEWQEMWVTVHWPSEPGFTEVRPSMPPPAHTANKSL